MAKKPRSPTQARYATGHGRPRSAGQSRLCQSAGLSRLDRSLSHRRRSGCPPCALSATAAAAHRPSEALEDALRELDGRQVRRRGADAVRARRRYRRRCFPSSRAGDHVLVTDSVYRPTRNFCDTDAYAARRGDDLLRSADRQRRRHAVQAEHACRVRRDRRAR